MARVYSRLLFWGFIYDASPASGRWYRDLIIPAGHTYILRHVAVSNDAGAAVSYSITVWGPQQEDRPDTIVMPIINGLSSASHLVSEWSGRIVVPGTHNLSISNSEDLRDGSGTGTFYISGYDLID